MIETFNVISIFGTGNAKALAGGISVALVTTQSGLLVAIPGLLVSALLKKQGGQDATLAEARDCRHRSPHQEIGLLRRTGMKSVRSSIRGGGDNVDINMGPLIDMVFLLLIFFVVTTSFVKEAGIDVQKSTAQTAEKKEKATIMIGVSPEGDVYMEGKKVDVRRVRSLVERSLAEDPEAGVIIIADKASETGSVVQVMDQCRLAGAGNISLAAKREDCVAMIEGPKGKKAWIAPAVIVALVANGALLWVMALLVSERGVPEASEDLGAISLVNFEPPEPPEPEETKEPEPPKPQQKLDFTPDLVQPDLMTANGADIGVAINLDGMGQSNVDEGFVFEAFELDEPPAATAKVPPVYPFRARESGIEGVVQVKLLINTDGSVGQVIIMDARPKGVFEDSVRKSVPRWKFSPGKIEGRAVTAWVVTAVRFTLN